MALYHNTMHKKKHKQAETLRDVDIGVFSIPKFVDLSIPVPCDRRHCSLLSIAYVLAYCDFVTAIRVNSMKKVLSSRTLNYVSQLTMEAHVRNVVRSCFYRLRQLRSIRRSPTDARRTLAAAFIASRADYCNDVLYGVSSQVIC